MEMLITQNPDLDSFGYILCASSNDIPTPRIDGHVVFNPDLSTYDGGDGSSTWMNYPGVPSNNQGVWGNCFDPEDPNYIWAAGQSGSINIMRGQWNASTLVDATNAIADLTNARDVAVAIEGSSKYAYVTRGSAQIQKCDVTANTVATSPAPFNILNLADTTRYSKAVDFDAAGNLYWTSRRTNSTTGDGGMIYRWDKSQIEGVAAGTLTEANATWAVTVATNGSNTEGVAITPDGNVYCAHPNEYSAGNDGSVRGIYLVGNTSQATNVKQLTVSDRVYQLYDSGETFTYFAFSIAADYAGNLYWADRVNEQIRCISPGGTTSVSVLAPTSQSLFVGVVSARNWILYE